MGGPAGVLDFSHQAPPGHKYQGDSTMSDVQTQATAELKVSPEAIEQLSALVENEEGVCGVRIFVNGSGCSGVQYGMTFVEEALHDDHVLEMDSVRLYIDPTTLGQLAGVEIDFQEQGENRSFVFRNVLAKGGGCGSCGSSGGGCA